MDFKRHMNDKQLMTLRKIHDMIQEFYKGKDNRITYALTGLISELTSCGYVDRRYVMEKVELIFAGEE